MRIKLMTKAIERELDKTPIGSTDDVAFPHRKVIVKYFLPGSAKTWYVVEGERRDDEYEWTFYNLMEGGDNGPEWGYITLGQLKQIRGQFKLPVERDRHYTQEEWVRDLKRMGLVT